MCGIIVALGATPERIEHALPALAHRGPDAAGLAVIGDVVLGHTRLAILDLNPRSNQPLTSGRTTVSYNGELWNYRQLRAELEASGRTFTTDGDTEVVAAALDTWGDAALPRFNGMFALAWTQDGTTIQLSRDRYGEIPLHLTDSWPFLAASEIKALQAAGAHPKAISLLEPGVLLTVSRQGLRRRRWYDLPTVPRAIDRSAASQELRILIERGVTERAISDVPVCTLLSGGIDSAAVAWALRQQLPDLVAYTAVYDPRAADLRAARLVANTLGIRLIEVPVERPTTTDLARVIQQIEMPYKAQVEIGWACLRLAERMRADGFKVTFSGEGSDELWASYGFAYHALQTHDWHVYRKHLFLDQHRKNFARCNKVFMAYGIECRLPFLHPSLVEFAISLPQSAVQAGKQRPKAVIQDAFMGRLPDPITRRAKVAFQDGMGLKRAIAERLPNPKRFYGAEYARYYG